MLLAHQIFKTNWRQVRATPWRPVAAKLKKMAADGYKANHISTFSDRVFKCNTTFLTFLNVSILILKFI